MNNTKNYFNHNHIHHNHHNVDRSRNQETRCAHTFHHNHDNHVCEPTPCRPRFHGAPHGFGSGLHVNAPCGRAGYGMHRPTGRPAHFHGCGRPEFHGRPGCGRPMNRPEFRGHRPGCGFKPFHPTEFRKTDDGLIIETKLAGFAPEDLKTAVEGERLTVTATRQTAEGEETFSCKYPLRGISKDAVTASLKNGLLTLILPFIKADEKTDTAADSTPDIPSGHAQPAAE